MAKDVVSSDGKDMIFVRTQFNMSMIDNDENICIKHKISLPIVKATTGSVAFILSTGYQDTC